MQLLRWLETLEQNLVMQEGNLHEQLLTLEGYKMEWRLHKTKNWKVVSMKWFRIYREDKVLWTKQIKL